jgi:hypothetical protein
MDTTSRDLDWRLGLEILSLDFTRSVYGDLGVGVACQETLRGMARDALLGLLESGTRGVRTLSAGEPESFFLVSAEPLLDIFRRAFGEGPSGRIKYWVEHVLCQENHNPWVLYERLFAGWASTLRRTGRDKLRLGNSAAAVQTKFLALGSSDAPERLLKERRGFLSEWDFKLFSKMGLLEIPEGSDFFPYVDAILLAISMKKFQDFWRWLVPFLGPAGVASVAAAAERFATDRHVAFCAPGELPSLPRDPP